MDKHIPQIIRDLGFDFDWDSEKVWAIKEPVVEMELKNLIWHFDVPYWEIEGTKEYTCTPWEVIREPHKHSMHYAQIKAADLEYPIAIMRCNDRWIILEGLHRLVKAHLEGKQKIPARIIPEHHISQIKKD